MPKAKTTKITKTYTRNISQNQPPKKKTAKTYTDFNITQEQYTRWVGELVKKGYSEQQINQIILRKYPQNSVETLIELHDNLFKVLQTNDVQDIHSQLIKISKNNGGGASLKAVRDNLAALKVLGFTADQVIRMVAHIGGANNLKAVRDNLAALEKLGFTADQVIRMVAHDGGAKNLQAVRDNLEALKALGFTADQVIRMVAHNGGAKNLQAVGDNLAALKGLGFKADQVVKMVAHDGGANNLQAVQDNLTALKWLGFRADKVVKMVAHKGGAKNLITITQVLSDLKELRFDSSSIKIITNKSERLEFINTLNCKKHQVNDETQKIMEKLQQALSDIEFENMLATCAEEINQDVPHSDQASVYYGAFFSKRPEEVLEPNADNEGCVANSMAL